MQLLQRHGVSWALFQNGKDTLQKFQSSSNGTSGRIKEKADANSLQKSQSSSEVGNSAKNTEKYGLLMENNIM